MLKQFYLSFENDVYDFHKIKHIQHNIHDRLTKLKYVTYRRIDIFLKSDEKILSSVDWDDKVTANIKCSINASILENLMSQKSIIEIYKAIFHALTELWKKSDWQENDLKTIFEEIQKDHFLVSVKYGKLMLSPNKKYKAELICDIYPDYAIYYVQFLAKRNHLLKKIEYLKGTPVLDSFFMFFLNRYWRDDEHFFIANIAKEIFYIFNVNKDDYTIEYKPMYNSLEQCKNHVRAFEADVSTQERRKLLGLPA